MDQVYKPTRKSEEKSSLTPFSVPGHPNAGKPSKSIMGVGMDLLAEHFESWREKIDDEIDDKCGPFKAVVK